MSKNELSLFDIGLVLFLWKKFLVYSLLIVLIISVCISFMLPKVYRAQATILPPSEQSSALGLSSLLSKLPVSGLGLGSYSEETSIYLAILNSRIIMESVVREFNLINRYHVKNLEEAVTTLRDNVSVKINEEGTITISAMVKTKWLSRENDISEARHLSSDIANYFIHELDRINKLIKVEKARNSRIILEKRYIQSTVDLKVAEDALKVFQEEYGVIALTEQTSVTISAAAELKSKIITKEIESDVLRNNLGDNVIQVKVLNQEISELQKHYNKLISNNLDNMNNDKEFQNSRKLFLSLNNIPELGMKYIRLYREIVLQSKILEFLLPEYEQAKIQEAKDTPTVQVLDPAVIPNKKFRPKRMIIVGSSVLSSIFLLFGFILLLERGILEDKNINPQKFAFINKLLQMKKI